MHWGLWVFTNLPPILETLILQISHCTETLSFYDSPFVLEIVWRVFPCIENFEFLHTSHYSEDFAFVRFSIRGYYTKQYIDFDRFFIFSALNKVLYKVFAYWKSLKNPSDGSRNPVIAGGGDSSLTLTVIVRSLYLEKKETERHDSEAIQWSAIVNSPTHCFARSP